MDLIALFTSTTFWVIFCVIVLLFWGIVGQWFRKVNITKGKALMIGVVALVLAMGGASWLGVGSVGTSVSGAPVVTQLQTTTAYAVGNSTADFFADVGADDTKKSVFYVNETYIENDVAYIKSGIFLATRQPGSLPASSCEVRVVQTQPYTISNTQYELVKRDAQTDIMTAYVHTATTSGAASTSDPKERNTLNFAEGTASGYVSFYIQLDETGIDILSQYDSQSVMVDVCGYPYEFAVVKADA